MIFFTPRALEKNNVGFAFINGPATVVVAASSQRHAGGENASDYAGDLPCGPCALGRGTLVEVEQVYHPELMEAPLLEELFALDFQGL